MMLISRISSPKSKLSSLTHIFHLHKPYIKYFSINNKNYYEILDISRASSQKQIKDAYYKLAKQYHPDITKGNEDEFKAINQAYEILGDEYKRKAYDSTLNSGVYNGSNSYGEYQQNNANNRRRHDYYNNDVRDEYHHYGYNQRYRYDNYDHMRKDNYSYRQKSYRSGNEEEDIFIQAWNDFKTKIFIMVFATSLIFLLIGIERRMTEPIYEPRIYPSQVKSYTYGQHVDIEQFPQANYSKNTYTSHNDSYTYSKVSIF